MKLKIFLFINFIVIFTCFIKPTTSSKIIICLDAGHGGIDGGGVVGDIKESDLALKYTLCLKEILEESGYQIVLTRSDDSALSSGDKFIKKEDLNKRVEIINNSVCSLFLSIHMNMFSDKAYSGAQVFYYDNASNKKLADVIQTSLIYNLSNTNRESKSINNIYLLKNVSKVGCLVECGFMSNEKELELLLNETYMKKLCNAIKDGVMCFLF